MPTWEISTRNRPPRALALGGASTRAVPGVGFCSGSAARSPSGEGSRGPGWGSLPAAVRESGLLPTAVPGVQPRPRHALQSDDEAHTEVPAVYSAAAGKDVPFLASARAPPLCSWPRLQVPPSPGGYGGQGWGSRVWTRPRALTGPLLHGQTGRMQVPQGQKGIRPVCSHQGLGLGSGGKEPTLCGQRARAGSGV